MAYKQDEPPAYGQPPQAPQAAYGGYQDPYQQGQFPQGQYQQGQYQQGPPMGYYNPQQGPFPAGQGPYPPQPGPYGQPPYGQQGAPPQGYFPGQQRESRSDGILTGLLAAMACCCCLDCLF